MIDFIAEQLENSEFGMRNGEGEMAENMSEFTVGVAMFLYWS